MEKFTYKTKGTCSRELQFEMEGDKIISLNVIGGCAGNLIGISRIVKNKQIAEIVEAFKDVECGNKGTSCPDQIAKALIAYQNRG